MPFQGHSCHPESFTRRRQRSSQTGVWKRGPGMTKLKHMIGELEMIVSVSAFAHNGGLKACWTKSLRE